MIFWPFVTLLSLVYFVGAFVVAIGALEILNGVFSIGRGWGWIAGIILGAIMVAIGAVALHYPIASVVTYFYLLGFAVLVRGVVKLFLPIESASLKTLVTIDAVCSILLGIVLLSNPMIGGFVFYWITGWYALIAGPIQIALSLRAKHTADRVQEVRAARRVPAHA